MPHPAPVTQIQRKRPFALRAHKRALRDILLTCTRSRSLIGIVAGLRTFTAPTAISWAAWSGRLALEGSWLAFLGYSWTPWIFMLLALGEFVGDQLPSTPSRPVPMQFGARLLSGAICGAAIGSPHGAILGGLLAGVVGAIIGTFGGHAFRLRSGRGVQEGSARRSHRRRHRCRRRVAHRPDPVVITRRSSRSCRRVSRVVHSSSIIATVSSAGW